jgi:hypothetical protein
MPRDGAIIFDDLIGTLGSCAPKVRVIWPDVLLPTNAALRLQQWLSCVGWGGGDGVS